MRDKSKEEEREDALHGSLQNGKYNEGNKAAEHQCILCNKLCNKLISIEGLNVRMQGCDQLQCTKCNLKFSPKDLDSHLSTHTDLDEGKVEHIKG